MIEVFPSEIGRQECLLSLPLFSVSFKCLIRAIEKGTKKHMCWKEKKVLLFTDKVIVYEKTRKILKIILRNNT